MKFILHFIICILFSFLTQNIAAQDYDNPGVYMSAIQKQQENVSKKYLTYTSASAHGKREKRVEALRSKLMEEIQESRMNIGDLPSYKGDKSYRDTAVNFFKFYYNVMNDDYSKIINMEDIAEQSYDDMEAYLLLEEKIQEKLKEANVRMSAAQKQFAAKNNINLLDDKSELSQMMEEVGGTNKHYHEVYLVYFKPFIQEKHFMEALEKGNITGMEQSKSAMKKYAEEGLAKLAAMKGYKGDNGLIGACKSMLTFYVKEADKAGAYNDYFLAKERFDAIKKDMDKKSNRTNEDVNAYNKAVSEINKSNQTYNSLNKDLNESRNQYNKDWNSAVKNFFDEHTPRYK